MPDIVCEQSLGLIEIVVVLLLGKYTDNVISDSEDREEVFCGKDLDDTEDDSEMEEELYYDNNNKTYNSSNNMFI